ncbi:MAG: right-handed parallel beta-helix repeat-containing protein [bacterium]
MRATLAVALAAGCALLPTGSRAIVRLVPQEHATIQAAVDLSVAGDSVLVGPGLWAESERRTIQIGGNTQPVTSVLFMKPGVAVIGTAGAEHTTLDGSPTASTTVIHYLPGSETAVVKGFTISATAAPSGTALLPSYASPFHLDSCRIVDSSTGISTVSQTLRVTNSYIARCGYQFADAVVGWDSHVVFEDTIFEGQNDGAQAIYLWSLDAPSRSLRLIRCTFRDIATLACQVYDANPLVIEESTFVRCGRGALLAGGSTGAIRFNTFAYDTSDGGGGAVLNNCDIEVSNNTFYRCRGTLVAAALSIAFTDGGVHNNIFTGCTGPRGTVSFGGGTQHPSTGCNLFWDNEGDDFWNDWVPAPTDIEADPEFCNETVLDLTLHSTSPAAPANSACGLLGAFDVGCGSVSVDATSWGRLKNLYRSSDHEDR